MVFSALHRFGNEFRVAAHHKVRINGFCPHYDLETQFAKAVYNDIHRFKFCPSFFGPLVNTTAKLDHFSGIGFVHFHTSLKSGQPR